MQAAAGQVCDAGFERRLLESDHAIRRLVRSTLGCTCPDRVFERIVRSCRQRPTHAHPYVVRLVIGDRLLIYLLDRERFDAAGLWLADMIGAGRRDRDGHGYNRFRAVISDADGRLAHTALEMEWRRLAAGDERLHLHLVHPDCLASSAGPEEGVAASAE